MLALIAFPFLALVTLWLLSRWAALRQLPPHVTATVFISFFVPVSVVALVPLDLVGDETLDNGARLLMWRAIYWASFFLMWLVLPVQQAYVESGYFAPLARLRDALKSTLKYHLVVLVLGVAGAIYMFVSTGVSFTSLKAVGVALSHSYGLVLVIYMLGHGLVDIPRRLWARTTAREQLGALYTRAVGVHDAYVDAQSSYDDVVARILALEPVRTEKYARWLDALIASIRAQDFPLARTSAPRAQPRDLTTSNLAALGARYKRELGRNTRARAEWSELLAAAQRLEESAESTAFAARVLRPAAVRASASLLAALGGIVTASEIAAGTRFSAVDAALLHAPNNALLRLLIASVVLGYMCVCVYSSLTSLKIFNLYAIVPKHTDASSLLFFAAYALRLTVPLSYNFLMLSSSSQHTVFQEFLGKFINLTALGKYFNLVIPRLIVLPMLMAAFDFYELVRDYLGFGLGLDYFDDAESNSNSTGLALQSEGREVVRRALSGYNSNINSNNGTQTAEPEQEATGIVDRVRSWF